MHEHRSCAKRFTGAAICDQTTPPLTDRAKHPTPTLGVLGEMTLERMDHDDVYLAPLLTAGT
jgi:hypothetical protein